MTSITPFTVYEIEQVINILYNRLCNSSFYESHRKITKGKHKFEDEYKMFTELLESLNYDNELLLRLKEIFDILTNDMSKILNGYKSCSKLEDNTRRIGDASTLLSSVMVSIYKKIE